LFERDSRHTIVLAESASRTPRAPVACCCTTRAVHRPPAFSTSRTPADHSDAKRRPVTFLWNGGPGSSTIWLHMGSFGPLRVAVPQGRDAAAADRAARRQRVVAARHQRPGVRRRGRDRLEQDRRAREDERLLRRRRGRARLRAVHRALGDGELALGIAEVLVRRVVRDDACGECRQRAAKRTEWPSTASCCSRRRSTTTFADRAGPGNDYGLHRLPSDRAAVAWYHHKVAGNPRDWAGSFARCAPFAGGRTRQALILGDALDARTRGQIVARLHAYTGLSTITSSARPADQPEPLSRECCARERSVAAMTAAMRAMRSIRTGRCRRTTFRQMTSAAVPSRRSTHYAHDVLATTPRTGLRVLSFQVNRSWSTSGARGRRQRRSPLVADLRSAIVARTVPATSSRQRATSILLPASSDRVFVAPHGPCRRPKNRRVTFAYFASGHEVYLNTTR